MNASPESTRNITPPFELRAEWYQVTYNLAAQYAHVVLSPPEQRQKRRAKPLSDQRGDEADAHLELREPTDAALGTAVEQCRLLLSMAARTLIRVPENGTRASDSRHAESARAAQAELRALLDFLQETVEPSAAVLLAGLILYAQGPVDVEPGMHLDRKSVARLDEGELDRELAPALVDYAQERKPIGYRAQYNLACYFAALSAQEGREDMSTTALTWLGSALNEAPRLEASRLASWAVQDPSLEGLRRAREAVFYPLVRRFELPT